MNFNPSEMLKNIKEVQKDVSKITAEGCSGGGLVKIELNGELKINKIFIDPIAVDSRDIEMLQDLIIAAMNSAQLRIEEKVRVKMSKTANMDMPFNMKDFT